MWGVEKCSRLGRCLHHQRVQNVRRMSMYLSHRNIQSHDPLQVLEYF